MTDSKFEPVRVIAKRIDADVVLVAEDATGAFRGIVLPAEVEGIALRIFRGVDKRHVQFWNWYERRVGGDCFFWSVHRICMALAMAPSDPDLRSLLRCPKPEDFLHNAYQAQLMVEARARFPGQVRLERRPKDLLQPDVAISNLPDIWHLEVKAVHRAVTLDMFDDGRCIAERDARAILRTITKDVGHGLKQVGNRGTVVVGIWCDLAGEILSEGLQQQIVDLDAVLQPGGVVLLLRDADGKDIWCRFDAASWEQDVGLVAGALGRLQQGPLKLGFSGGIESVIGGTTAPQSVGRSIGVNYVHEMAYSYHRFLREGNRPLAPVSSESLSAASELLTVCYDQLRIVSDELNQRGRTRIEFATLHDLMRDRLVASAFTLAFTLGRVVRLLVDHGTPDGPSPLLRIDPLLLGRNGPGGKHR